MGCWTEGFSPLMAAGIVLLDIDVVLCLQTACQRIPLPNAIQ